MMVNTATIHQKRILSNSELLKWWCLATIRTDFCKNITTKYYGKKMCELRRLV